MRYFIAIIFIVGAICAQTGDSQSFKLKDGTVINGKVIEENEEMYTVQTKYGTITVNKNELLETEYEINLKSGETFRGLKTSETSTSIQLKTNRGILNIEKSDILDIKESGQVTQTESQSPSEPSEVELYFQNKSSSPFDFLFGSTKPEKDIEFAMGEERLIDTFFDPTGYVLDDATLYLSGLSFAFGLSEKLHVSSRWTEYFRGNFNLRPKYMLFQKGNWEKESALAIGGHFHTYWQPNKVVWKTGSTKGYTNKWNGSLGEYVINDSADYYYGGYFPIGATIKGRTITIGNYDPDGEEEKLEVTETEDLDFMVEFFTAYTFSKARKGMRGRVSNTIGAMVQIPVDGEWPYRFYWGADVDITPRLKMIGEAFYDPFYLDTNNKMDTNDCDSPFECIFGGNYTYETSESKEITKDDFKSIRPIHFDFGFIYAVNEHFRFGIHTQPYILAFYWKF